MKIKIKPISKEALEKNGWDYEIFQQRYYKKFNECWVCIDSPDCDLDRGCQLFSWDGATPDDLIAIGNELKKLEEN